MLVVGECCGVHCRMLGMRPPLGWALAVRGRMGGRTGGGLNGADEGEDVLRLLINQSVVSHIKKSCTTVCSLPDPALTAVAVKRG